MGSLVLDIAPALRAKDYRAITDIFVQGKVTELSGVSFYMGGCVGNTGMALHKLGVDATLGCKVGRDFAGNAIELMLSRAFRGRCAGDNSSASPSRRRASTRARSSSRALCRSTGPKTRRRSARATCSTSVIPSR